MTYDDHHLPNTLSKDHLARFLKRLRKAYGRKRVRFLACGEYGDLTHRPHYHAILWGVPYGCPLVQRCWPYGFAQTHQLSDAAVAYVAGYVSKKLGKNEAREERVNPETGEVFNYQPPFLQSSRRPGIGASARQYWKSWRRSAVVDGREVPVPRYFHEAYKKEATPEQLAALTREINEHVAQLDRTPARLESGEIIAHAKRSMAALRRTL